MSRKVSLVFLSSPPGVRFPGIVPRVNDRRTGCFMPTRLSGGRVTTPEGCPENPQRERLEQVMMIVLFIVLARNKLRIPLEGTYSREM